MRKKKTNRTPRSRGIAETYIHIRDVPRGLSKKKARDYLERNARLWAEQKFKRSVIVKIRVEDGSLKVWVLVGGLTLFNVVSNYGSFRSGIDHMVSDAKSFSSFVIDKFSEDEGVEDQAVIRAERRLGVPGKIQRFMKSLDKLNSADIGHNERHIRIQEIREEFIEILRLLDDPQDRDLFMQQVPENIVHDPDVPVPEPIPGVLSLDYIRNEEDWNA